MSNAAYDYSRLETVTTRGFIRFLNYWTSTTQRRRCQILGVSEQFLGLINSFPRLVEILEVKTAVIDVTCNECRKQQSITVALSIEPCKRQPTACNACQAQLPIPQVAVFPEGGLPATPVMSLSQLGPKVILVAEDDRDDREFLQDAWASAGLIDELFFVDNGQQLLNYLERKPPYVDTATYPKPDLLLLDLNMPKISGLEALAAIRKNPKTIDLPVVVLTTSRAEEERVFLAEFKSTGFISKPRSYSQLIELFLAVAPFWLGEVENKVMTPWPDNDYDCSPSGSVEKN